MVCILTTLATYKFFGAKLQLTVVLCALLELDYPLNMKIVQEMLRKYSVL